MYLKILTALFALLVTSHGHSSETHVEYFLTVDPIEITAGGVTKKGIGYNGKSPGETLRFTEGDTAVIHVTNNLDTPTSIHWHGLILPFTQDGVPGISFPGINPGDTFTYTVPNFAKRVPIGITVTLAFKNPTAPMGRLLLQRRLESHLSLIGNM